MNIWQILLTIVLSFSLGYKYHKVKKEREEKKLFDECEKISQEFTSHEAIERDVNKKLMQKVLENKLKADLEKDIKTLEDVAKITIEGVK